MDPYLEVQYICEEQPRQGEMQMKSVWSNRGDTLDLGQAVQAALNNREHRSFTTVEPVFNNPANLTNSTSESKTKINESESYLKNSNEERVPLSPRILSLQEYVIIIVISMAIVIICIIGAALLVIKHQKLHTQQGENKLSDTSCQQDPGGDAHDNYAGNLTEQYRSEYQENGNPGSDENSEYEVERNPGRSLNKSPQPDLIPCRTGYSEDTPSTLQGIYNLSCSCRANIHFTIQYSKCGECHGRYNKSLQNSFGCQV